jgi:3-oxoacyl-[acyl-carrier-protein] synthase-3
VLLSDGAGAVVIGQSEDNEILATYTEAEGKYGKLLYLEDVIDHQLIEGNQVCFSRGDAVERPYLRMQGKKVFPVAVRTMSKNIKKVIERYNANTTDKPIEQSDIEYVYPHQANLRIINAIAEYMNMPLENVYTEGIKKYGNNSAASIPIGYVETRDKVKGKLVVDVAFGAGFASGAILRRA